MNIIALFLHILWDRKCKELLIPISEAEMALCFCFQIAPDSDLPQLIQKQGAAYSFGAWAHTEWVHTHMYDICTQTAQYTHDTHTRRDSPTCLLSLAPTHMPSIQRAQLSHPVVQDHFKCIADYL